MSNSSSNANSMSCQRTNTTTNNNNTRNASSPHEPQLQLQPQPQPRKLTMEEASQHRFHNRVSKGIATLVQHGYSVRRATHIVRLELASVGTTNKKANDGLDSTLEKEKDEVFRLMNSRGHGMDETTTALVISNAFERIKSQKQVSTDRAMDYLSSRITTMKLLAHVEHANQTVTNTETNTKTNTKTDHGGSLVSTVVPHLDEDRCTTPPTTNGNIPSVLTTLTTTTTNATATTTTTTTKSRSNTPSTNTNGFTQSKSNPLQKTRKQTQSSSIATTKSSTTSLQQPQANSNTTNTNTNTKPSTITTIATCTNSNSNSSTLSKNSKTNTNLKQSSCREKRSRSCLVAATRTCTLDEHTQERLSSQSASQSNCKKRPRLDSV